MLLHQAYLFRINKRYMNKDTNLIAEAFRGIYDRHVYVLLREHNDGREVIYGIFTSVKEARKAEEDSNRGNQFTPITSKYTIKKVVLNPAIPDSDYLYRTSDRLKDKA